MSKIKYVDGFEIQEDGAVTSASPEQPVVSNADDELRAKIERLVFDMPRGRKSTTGKIMQLIQARDKQREKLAEATGYKKGRMSVSLAYSHTPYDIEMQSALKKEGK